MKLCCHKFGGPCIQRYILDNGNKPIEEQNFTCLSRESGFVNKSANISEVLQYFIVITLCGTRSYTKWFLILICLAFGWSLEFLTLHIPLWLSSLIIIGELKPNFISESNFLNQTDTRVTFFFRSWQCYTCLLVCTPRYVTIESSSLKLTYGQICHPPNRHRSYQRIHCLLHCVWYNMPTSIVLFKYLIIRLIADQCLLVGLEQYFATLHAAKLISGLHGSSW